MNKSRLHYTVTNDNTELVETSMHDNILTLKFDDDDFGTANITIRATDAKTGFVEDSFQ